MAQSKLKIFSPFFPRKAGLPAQTTKLEKEKIMQNKNQNRGQDDSSDNQKRDQQQKNQQGQQKKQGEAGQDENLNPQGNRDIRQAPASPNANQEEREDTTSQGGNRLNAGSREHTQREDSQQPRSRRLNPDQENEDAEDATAEQGSAETDEKKTSKTGQKSGY
jgi:hypothetical protein